MATVNASGVSFRTLTEGPGAPIFGRSMLQWEGVEHFLRDFSELEDAPSGHLVLWERYLVYAVALGVSEELVRGLALRVQGQFEDNKHLLPTTDHFQQVTPTYFSVRRLGTFGSVDEVLDVGRRASVEMFTPRLEGERLAPPEWAVALFGDDL